VLGQAANLPEFTALGLGAGVTLAALKSVSEWREKNQEIERNQLYFYYKAGDLLSKGK
jgi:hypothetical protein